MTDAQYLKFRRSLWQMIPVEESQPILEEDKSGSMIGDE
jgi:hypothetical protein